MPETIMMRRLGYKLSPVALVDEEALEQFPENKDLTVTISRSRSPRQHRFFWALLQKICENHETYRRPEALLLWLKVRLGYVEEVKFHNGEMWWTAKSISFSAMDQTQFKTFFDAALDIIANEVIPGLNTEELILEIEAMMGFRLIDIWSEKNGV
jgi:hypothetical protein